MESWSRSRHGSSPNSRDDGDHDPSSENGVYHDLDYHPNAENAHAHRDYGRFYPSLGQLLPFQVVPRAAKQVRLFRGPS